MTSPTKTQPPLSFPSLHHFLEINLIVKIKEKDPFCKTKQAKMSAPNPNDKQASMLAGHAQYAKGYVEETVRLLSPSFLCNFFLPDDRLEIGWQPYRLERLAGKW